MIDRNLLPILGNVPLSKLGAAYLDRFYRRLREKGGRAGRSLAPATIRRAHFGACPTPLWPRVR